MKRSGCLKGANCDLEVNRVLTDQISSMLFTPSFDGNQNLVREGIPQEKIFLVGNVMIDTLVSLLPMAMTRQHPDLPAKYALVTLHRPSNVDESGWFRELLHALDDLSKQIPLVFPVHPRTRQRLSELGCSGGANGLYICEPQPYLEFLSMERKAAFVITDSGGIQEETTFFGVPCLTVRDNTERPVTVELGTNILVGRDMQTLRAEVERILDGVKKEGTVPPLWDGHAAERIADVICSYVVCDHVLARRLSKAS